MSIASPRDRSAPTAAWRVGCLSALLWLAACGGGHDSPPPDDEVPPDPSLRARIDVAVERITADACFAQVDTSACEWSNYSLGPNSFDMSVSTGEAILIVDDIEEGALPQLLRYRNRILGLYRVNGQAMALQMPSVRLPKRLGDALVSFAGPEFIPARQLAPVGHAAGTAYKNVPLLFLGHGGVVFSHLVEVTPEQPLVLLNLRGLTGLLPSLCAGVDGERLAAARLHFEAVASAVRGLMRDRNVRFVNASFGDSAPTLARDWSRTCGTAVPSADVVRQLLHLYEPIYEALLNTPGVITAHAASDLGDPADFPFDQVGPQFKNRSRVGFFSSRNSGLDAFGRGAVQKAEQFPRGNSDADVFVNWRCEVSFGCAQPHYEMAGAFGLGVIALPLMTSSYVTPLALGRLINLRYAQHEKEVMSDALIQTLKQELTPSLCGPDHAQPCIYQDPIAHGQLEALGWRTP